MLYPQTPLKSNEKAQKYGLVLSRKQAAAIIASWFGAKSGWRGQTFPVLYNALPDRNAIVFATNDHRPDFLREHPPVTAPTIEMIDHPNNPYMKLLVVFRLAMVDFPEPERPTRATVLPAGIFRLMLRRAGTSRPG